MNLLIIDTGSSSMRGTLIGKDSRTLFSSSKEYYMETDSSGKSEMNPAVFEEALHEVCKNAAVFARENRIRIDAVSLTSQRSSVLAVSNERKPLGNIITWHDKRSAGICDAVNREHGELLYSICGARLTPIASAPKIALMRDIYPDQYAKAEKIIGIHDYLLLLLTGSPATDTSLASRTCLLDIRSLTWSDTLLDLFRIEKDKLCPLLRPGDTAGTVVPSFARDTGLPEGIPVITAGGDQQCSVLGQGLYTRGEAGITLGTGSYVCLLTDEPVFAENSETKISVAVIPGHWIIEASTFSSGLVYNWFNRQFYPEENQSYPYELIDADVRNTPPGANQVVALPSLSGKGCPDWNPYAKGVFYNLGIGTTRADMARALLESIAADISGCYAVLASMQEPKTVKICGGLAKFDVLLQMLADMTNHSVHSAGVRETTVMGAWAVAAVALGIVPSFEKAIAVFSEGKEQNMYRPVAANHDIYQRIGLARQKLYESLPFRRLGELLRDETGIFE